MQQLLLGLATVLRVNVITAFIIVRIIHDQNIRKKLGQATRHEYLSQRSNRDRRVTANLGQATRRESLSQRSNRDRRVAANLDGGKENRITRWGT
ncbi:hypothetical protein O181_034633 [Austropuccinia psidii MF-1]|uniref:Uncharacterized protein n=1 Tax=Austropuccinia psidii MF-1 TaxID=1389203 RepID=A0A9Q3H7I9_9BASI|nr:hypothetical protein [Austropuccinia psidii MF-1]